MGRRFTDFPAMRAEMVERHLRGRGIEDEEVLRVMGEVPRETFVLEDDTSRAYGDRALPIGFGQTISQPWIVARMVEALELTGRERVLEVGTGSGYSTAILAQLASEVISIERVDRLSRRAHLRLSDLGITNVRLMIGDGSRGVPSVSDFDAIVVHATSPSPPEDMLRQLAIDGRLVVPIAAGSADLLTLYVRTEGFIDVGDGTGLNAVPLGRCRFVPLIGEAGFAVEANSK